MVPSESASLIKVSLDLRWRKTLSINDECDVFDKYGVCKRAFIIERVADQIKIRYVNWSHKYDEWLSASNKRISPPNTFLIPFIKVEPKRITQFMAPFHCFNNITKQHYLTVDVENPGCICYYNIATETVRNDPYPSGLQDRLNTFYPILDDKTNKLWFIDICGLEMVKWDTNKNKYISSKNTSLSCFHQFGKKYNRKNLQSFMADNELHILYGNSKRIQHIKYNEKENIFITMDNFTNKKKINFIRQNFIYNSYQKRLYMVCLNKGNKKNSRNVNVSILYIDDINQWENKWAVKYVRKWNTFNTTIEISDNKFSLNGYRCVIVYDIILMVVIGHMILCIDLTDFSVYLNDTYLHRTEKETYKYVLNTYDNYVHIIDFPATSWYKVYLPTVIPKTLFLKYRNRIHIVVQRYIEEFVNKHQIYSAFPHCLTQLISIQFL